jgi:hypothetical protein
MPVSGNEIVEVYIVLDQSSVPLTGLTGGSGAGGFTNADFIVTLHRQSGTTYAAATEVLTLAETATAGYYAFRFTPTQTGTYFVHTQELDPLTNGYTHDFRYEVYSGGSVFLPSYANAFCAETDIERWLSQGISSTTNPSDTVAAAFAESRAAMLMTICSRLGFEITPATVTNGSRIQDLLREANAIGAAWDYTVAQAFGTGPSRTDRATWLESLWNRYVGDGDEIVGILELEIRGNLAAFATDHILSGDTLPATPTYPTDIGIQVSMRDQF